MPKLLAAALAVLFAAAATAQTYRWVDKDGKVHYSDTPPPPAAAKSVEKRSGSGSVVQSGQVPFATQQAIRNAPVTIYTAETCKQICDDARKLLQSRGVPFREIAVADEASREELKKVSGGQEVPVMVAGKQVTTGYSADSWNTALDAAGYPKSGPPLAAQQAPKPGAPAAKAQPPEPADDAPKQGPYAPR